MARFHLILNHQQLFSILQVSVDPLVIAVEHVVDFQLQLYQELMTGYSNQEN